MQLLYVLVAILIFGLLIFIHEGGHYLFARLFHVSITEFAIGFGPKLLSRTSEKTGIAYSLRAIPFGGFVAMVGEDEDSDDPNAFHKKPVWQRFIITAAGASVNLLAGILVMSILVATSPSLPSTVIYDMEISGYTDTNTSADSGLLPGDRIVAVEGTRVHTGNELVYEVMRKGVDPIDVTLVRDGETITLSDVVFPTTTESGVTVGLVDFRVYSERRTPANVLKHAFFRSTSTIKMIWESLYDLVRGRYGLEAVSGPVGATQAMTEAASSSARDLIYLSVVISMNLGIMNLLPLPALDGGRLVFLLIEGIRRKPFPRKVEGYVNFAGLAILMGLMVLVTVKDVLGLLH